LHDFDSKIFELVINCFFPCPLPSSAPGKEGFRFGVAGLGKETHFSNMSNSFAKLIRSICSRYLKYTITSQLQIFRSLFAPEPILIADKTANPQKYPKDALAALVILANNLLLLLEC